MGARGAAESRPGAGPGDEGGKEAEGGNWGEGERGRWGEKSLGATGHGHGRELRV